MDPELIAELDNWSEVNSNQHNYQDDHTTTFDMLDFDILQPSSPGTTPAILESASIEATPAIESSAIETTPAIESSVIEDTSASESSAIEKALNPSQQSVIKSVLSPRKSVIESAPSPRKCVIESAPPTPRQSVIESAPQTPRQSVIESAPPTPRQSVIESAPQTPRQSVIESAPNTPKNLATHETLTAQDESFNTFIENILNDSPVPPIQPRRSTRRKKGTRRYLNSPVQATKPKKPKKNAKLDVLCTPLDPKKSKKDPKQKKQKKAKQSLTPLTTDSPLTTATLTTAQLTTAPLITSPVNTPSNEIPDSLLVSSSPLTAQPPSSPELVSHNIVNGQVPQIDQPSFPIPMPPKHDLPSSSVNLDFQEFDCVEAEEKVMKYRCPKLSNHKKGNRMNALMNEGEQLSEILKVELEKFLHACSTKFDDLNVLYSLGNETLESMNKSDLESTLKGIRDSYLKEKEASCLKKEMLDLIRKIQLKNLSKFREKFIAKFTQERKKFKAARNQIVKQYTVIQEAGLEILHARYILEHFNRPARSWKKDEHDIQDLTNIANVMKDLFNLFDPEKCYDYPSIYNHFITNFKTNKDTELVTIMHSCAQTDVTNPDEWKDELKDYIKESIKKFRVDSRSLKKPDLLSALVNETILDKASVPVVQVMTPENSPNESDAERERVVLIAKEAIKLNPEKYVNLLEGQDNQKKNMEERVEEEEGEEEEEEGEEGEDYEVDDDYEDNDDYEDDDAYEQDTDDSEDREETETWMNKDDKDWSPPKKGRKKRQN